MEPDVLYVVRSGERNDSLRLSLRSLANLPHRRVFIAGYCPSWARNVVAIPVRSSHNKFVNIERNLLAGLSHPDIRQEVVYMNDDFYITHPIDRVPVMHGGPTAEYRGRQELRVRMRNTVKALQAWRGAESTWLSYDGIHVPLPLVRDEVLLALHKAQASTRRPILWRTWYGNVCRIGGDRVPDAKYRGPAPRDGTVPTFMSTNAGGLNVTRHLLEEILPDGSPYIAA